VGVNRECGRRARVPGNHRDTAKGGANCEAQRPRLVESRGELSTCEVVMGPRSNKPPGNCPRCVARSNGWERARKIVGQRTPCAHPRLTRASGLPCIMSSPDCPLCALHLSVTTCSWTLRRRAKEGPCVCSPRECQSGADSGRKRQQGLTVRAVECSF